MAIAVCSYKYDSIAKNYNRRYEENDYGGIQQHLLAFVDKQTEGVLEVGCGTDKGLIAIIYTTISRRLNLGNIDQPTTIS